MLSKDEILKIVKREGINVIRFQWIGNDLLLRAKAAHADYLESHMDTGIGIAKAIQSFNVLDHLVPEGAFGAEASEFRILPDLSTFAIVPYAPKNARFICELNNLDLKPSETDGRSFLRKIIKQSDEMGYKLKVACETEFYTFKWVDGKPIPNIMEKYGTTHGFDLANELIQEWINCLTAMHVKIERVIKEYGPSQFEITMRYSDALKAADDMVTLRDVTRGVALKYGLDATFMPKPFQGLAGSGMHLHISLWDNKNEKNIFYDKEDPRNLGFSEIGYFFIGGILKHVKGLCALCAPLSNSYKRLLPGSWAPAHICYGLDNRAATIRVPSTVGADGNSVRIEFRVPDPAANPYIAIGATVAAGLEGIKNRIDPGEPIKLDPARLNEDELEKSGIGILPRTLGEALEELKRDEFLKSALGKMLFEEYTKARKSEWKDYREQVTEWEIKNYIGSL
jgi:glutamine synthetase